MSCPSEPFGDALEIGSGTGYFSLNLMQEGVITNLVATDVSTGMLTSLSATAESLGFADRVETRQADAEELPFEDESFDLVLGHAVLHHIPDLSKAFSEFDRVLRPGGAIVFCGEPSAYGDRLAAVPKRIGAASAPAWRTLMRARPAEDDGAHESPHDGHGLESEVDVHAFDPGALRDWMARDGLPGHPRPGRGAPREHVRLDSPLTRVERQARGRSGPLAAGSRSVATSPCNGPT